MLYQCGKDFKNKMSLKCHIRSVHEHHEKVSCTICSKEFTRRENMVRHIKDIHEGIKKYKCDVCSQAFCSSTVSSIHIFLLHKINFFSSAKFCIPCGPPLVFFHLRGGYKEKCLKYYLFYLFIYFTSHIFL